MGGHGVGIGIGVGGTTIFCSEEAKGTVVVENLFSKGVKLNVFTTQFKGRPYSKDSGKGPYSKILPTLLMNHFCCIALTEIFKELLYSAF